MSPQRGDRLSPPRWLSWALRLILDDADRAAEVSGDLEEMVRSRRPLLPSLFYAARVAWLAARLLVTRRAVDAPERRVSSSLMDLGMDIRLTLRTLLRRPAPALTVVATLGLAIGFNAAVFALLEAIVLEPLPFPEGERLVVLDEVNESTGFHEDLSALDLMDFQRATTRLSALSGWQISKLARTSEDGTPESLSALRVTDELFEVLRVPALIGRTILPGDDGNRVVVVSEGYWARQLGADPGIVGQSLTLNGVPFEVLGVMPAGFRFPEQDIDVWVPAAFRGVEQANRAHRSWNAIGRLAPGATALDAEAELNVAMASLAEAYPQSNKGWRMSVEEAGAALREAGNLPFLLAGAVGLVLLIACVNAANILFVRSLERSGEVAIRSALGASRGRLARLVLLEALILAMAAGAVGLLGSVGVVGLLERLDPGVIPAWEALSVDWSVALFSLGLAAVTALLAAALPALHVTRPGLAATLGEFGSRTSGGRVDRRLRNGLVTAEVALTLVLLHGAGLLVWSLYSVSEVDPGFDQAQLLTATAVLRGSGGELTTQFEEIMERLDAVPGIISVGTVSALPMNPVGAQYNSDAYSIEYPERTPVEDRPEADIRVVSPGYLETMNIPLLAGRSVAYSDRNSNSPVILVNKELADRYFPNGDAVGGHISFGAPRPPGFEIVGVVGNVKHSGLDAEPRPEIYLGFLQMPHNDLTFVIKTLGDPSSVIPAVRNAVAEVAPDIPLVGVATMDAIISGSLDRRRFNVAIFGAVALVALLLACLGIYGVTSYSVSRRQREIGIRMAVGAQWGNVLGEVMKGTMRIVLLGVSLGMVGAFAGARLLEAQLFGIEATSVSALVGAGVVVGFVALIGCWGPAARASRIDPVGALRGE